MRRNAIGGICGLFNATENSAVDSWVHAGRKPYLERTEGHGTDTEVQPTARIHNMSLHIHIFARCIQRHKGEQL